LESSTTLLESSALSAPPVSSFALDDMIINLN
jgi:hypothetical protein